MFKSTTEKKKIKIISSITGNVIDKKDYGKLKHLIYDNNIIYSVAINIILNYKSTHDISFNYQQYRDDNRYDYEYEYDDDDNLQQVTYNLYDIYSIRILINKIENLPDESIVYGVYESLLQQYDNKFNITDIFENFNQEHIIYRDLFYYLLTIKKISAEFIESNYKQIMNLYNDDIQIIIELIKLHTIIFLLPSEKRHLSRETNRYVETYNLLRDSEFINKINNDIDITIQIHFKDITQDNFHERFKNYPSYFLGNVLYDCYKNNYEDDYLIDLRKTYKIIVSEIKYKFDYDTYKLMILEAYNYDFRIFFGLDNDDYNNKDIVLLILDKSYKVTVGFIPEIFCNDIQVVTKAVENNGDTIKYISDELYEMREIVLKAVRSNGSSIRYISDTFINDKEIILEAVKNNGNALKYVSEKYRNDREIVLQAVSNDGRVLKYVSDELRNDKNIILAAIRNDGRAFVYISSRFLSDDQVVLEAVKNHGHTLRYVPESFCDNKDLILQVVKKNGLFLQYASSRLRNDIQVVLEAIKSYGRSLQYASKKLRGNRTLILDSIKKNIHLLEFAARHIRNNKKIMTEVIHNNSFALPYMSKRLRNNKKMVLKAVKDNGKMLKYASYRLRNNKIVVLEAMRNDRDAFMYASENIRKNQEVLLCNR